MSTYAFSTDASSYTVFTSQIPPTAWEGVSFTVAHNELVTQLGVFPGGNGTSSTYLVDLLDASGTILGALTLTSDTATTEGVFEFGSLSTPVTLQAGQTYYLVSQTQDATVNNLVVTASSSVVSDPNITFNSLMAYVGSAAGTNNPDGHPAFAPSTLSPVEQSVNLVLESLTAGLQTDTGDSSTDGITSNATLSGLAAAGDILTIANGSKVLGTTTANADGSWSYTPTGLANGAYTLTVTSADSAASANVSFTLQSVASIPAAPVFTVSSMASNVSLPTITGTAVAGSTVTVLDDGTVAGTVVADSSTGAFSFTFSTALSTGLNTITATATTDGGTSAASTALNLYELPSATNGISAANLSISDLQSLAASGVGMQFSDGTQSISVPGAILSIGEATQQATIQRLYTALLGRGSDTTGISFYNTQLDAGFSKQTIAAEILDSTEYTSAHSDQTDQQFVDMLYQNVLGRSASDDTQSSYWTNLLAQGDTRADVAVSVSDSTEAQNTQHTSTSALFVNDPASALAQVLSQTGTGQAADASLLATISADYLSQTPAQLAAQFANSASFAADHATQDNTAFVDSLYHNGLGRAADAVGAAYWTDALNNGASRADVLLGIASSTEAAKNLL